jgi:hypothetical protein
LPSARSLYVFGDVHAAKAAPLRLHSKPDPASDEVNEMAADRSVTVPDGAEVIVVSGGVVSGGSGVVVAVYSTCRAGALVEPPS